MAKKYIIKSFNPSAESHKHINPLINLSSLGINANSNILKTALGLSATQTMEGGMEDQYYPNLYDATGANAFSKFRDLTKNTTNNYAFYDMSYAQRRDFCRSLSRYGDMNFVLDTISNEAIIQDDNGYIAQLDLDKLRLFLNKDFNSNNGKTNADTIIRDCKISYNTIYSALGWDKNNGAWSYFRKFLVEGFLAFEILLDEKRKRITGFLELDAITLEPGIEYTEDGQELFIWYQYKGESRERKIPDSNLIYISWNNVSVSNTTNISYLETLTRSYNMLIQLENSQLIWNIQNAQKRMKITVPVGDMAEDRAEAKLSEIMATYNEEVSMDDASGQLLVNGEPRFNFQKTFVFEDRGGSTIGLEEISAEGVNMNSTESLSYYWRRFVMDTQIPANRFPLNIASAPSNALLGDATITREEYAFKRFIQRVQSIFKEILLKPLWVELCLKHPELSYTNYLKQGLGITFNEENIFTAAKERQMLSDGASTISTLSQIMVSENNPYFSMEYLIKKYLGLSEQEIEINRKYKEGEILKSIEIAKLQKKHAEDALVATQPAGPGSAPAGEGGGNDFGGGFGGSTGGDVMGGGEFGGGAETAPEPAAAPEPSGDEGGGGFGE